MVNCQKKHDEYCKYLLNKKYLTLYEKQRDLITYMKKFTNMDIRNALFIELSVDEYRYPTLERSINRGENHFWVINEFIETKQGIAPRWFVENKTPP